MAAYDGLRTAPLPVGPAGAGAGMLRAAYEGAARITLVATVCIAKLVYSPGKFPRRHYPGELFSRGGCDRPNTGRCTQCALYRATQYVIKKR